MKPSVESDRELEEIFQRVWGEAPSDEERRAILQLKENFNIRNNDALWTIVLALRYHLTLYEGIPKQIEDAVTSMLQSARETAKASADGMKEDTKRELAEAVRTTASQVAEATAERAKWNALKWAAIVSATVVLGVGAISYTMGKQNGYAEGSASAYHEAKNEEARASWANTPQGRRAFALAQAGSIDALALCNSAGWELEGTACHPKPGPDGRQVGWYVKPK